MGVYYICSIMGILCINAYVYIRVCAVHIYRLILDGCTACMSKDGFLCCLLSFGRIIRITRPS